MDLTSRIRILRDLALAECRTFLRLYEAALAEGRFLAADNYRIQRDQAEGRVAAYAFLLSTL